MSKYSKFDHIKRGAGYLSEYGYHPGMPLALLSVTLPTINLILLWITVPIMCFYLLSAYDRSVDHEKTYEKGK